MVSIVGS
jgi:formate hydrogenlyase transcriptional activator